MKLESYFSSARQILISLSISAKCYQKVWNNKVKLHYIILLQYLVNQLSHNTNKKKSSDRVESPGPHMQSKPAKYK